MRFTPEPLYTPAEVAALFGVQPQTVNRWVRSRRIPPAAVVRTPAGTRRYRASAIDQLRNGGSDG
jgi:DNA-binding transcriptional MerR regulator